MRPARLSPMSLLLAVCPQLAWAIAPASPYREGELIVKYRDAGSAVALKSAVGLSTRREIVTGDDGSRTELVALPAMTTVAQAIELLQADAGVEYAEPNFRRHKFATVPNDPLFPDQWGLRNTGQANFVEGGPAGTPGADLNLVEAWDADGDGVADRTGRSSVIVAVIDDGVETTHEDLAANIVAGYDYRDNDNNPNPADDDDYHGTPVAGCVGAVGNNGLGVAGVSWNARIMPIRFDYDVATHVQALQFAKANGAKIINASFGGPGFSQTELDAIRGLASSDILYVAAAGNDDSNIDRGQINYPANYDADNIVTVASISRQGQITSFSQYGALSVDVAAPGLQIATTAIHNRYTYTGAESFGISGTSFAAPYVAGVAALIRSHVSGADYRQVKARLIESGQNGENARQRSVGGRVDADRALEMAARPSLIVKSVTLDPTGNGVLDPGETAIVRVVVQNLWQAASEVTLAASADNGLSFAGGPASLGTLAQGATATADLQVTVPASLAGHHYIQFTFALNAAGGYSTTRGYIDEVARLPLGDAVTQSFAGGEADLYDEYHAWHFQLDAAAPALIVETDADADVDFLLKRGTPPQYNITVGIDPEDDDDDNFFCTSGTASRCLDPATEVAADTDSGVERICLENAQAGTYHLVAIDFAQQSTPLPYRLRAYTADHCDRDGDGGGGGGGAFGAPLSALLALIAALRARGPWRLRRASRPARSGTL